jgi:tetratricopeptide (TPR) repeat protein
MIRFSIFIIFVLMILSCAKKDFINTDKDKSYKSDKKNDSLNQKIMFYTNEINKNPDDIDLLKKRSKTYRLLKEYDLALNDINKAIEMNPDSAEQYYQRGFIYIKKKQYDQAIRDFDSALGLDSNHVAANIEIGFSYAKSEKFEIAKKYLDKSIVLDTLKNSAYYYRGVCNFKMSNYLLALSDFNKAIELNKDLAHFYSARSKTYLMLNRIYEAFSDVNKAIELDPEDLELLSDKDHINKQIDTLKKLESKIKEYTDMIISGEPGPEIYFQRGMSYFGMLDYIPKPNDETWKKIENDMKKYIELAPTGKHSRFANYTLSVILSARESKKN